MERDLKKFFVASHQVWIAMLVICVLAIVGTGSLVYDILYALVGCVSAILLSKMSVRHYAMAVPILFVVECTLLAINIVAPDSVWLKFCSVKCHPYYLLGIVMVSTSTMIVNIRNRSIRYKVIALVTTNMLLIGLSVWQDTSQDSMMFPVGTLACSYRALQEMFGNYILIIPNAIFCLGAYQVYKILRISNNLFLRLLGIGLSLVVVTESLCDTSSVLSNTSTIGSPYLIMFVELGIILTCVKDKTHTLSIAKRE